MLVIPFAAGLVGLVFSLFVLRQWWWRRKPYQFAWGVALAMFALAAVTEGMAGTVGWSDASYRLYYLFGGLLDVLWLGAGSVLILLRQRGAAAVLLVVGVVSAVAIVGIAAAPVHGALLHQAVPPRGAIDGIGPILAPITNSLGSLALIGGAAWSAWTARRHGAARNRVGGLVLIAGGAFVAAAAHGLGGEVAGIRVLAPIGELVAIAVMFCGYLVLESPLRVGQRRAAEGRT
ncbi:MAG TPA: hypothetical protein VIA06_10670 [Candidatus Dormibacteraeota bacterium]|nr:hypothetical protein [Candidatus Dormibacteraeota bacterium]